MQPGKNDISDDLRKKKQAVMIRTRVAERTSALFLRITFSCDGSLRLHFHKPISERACSIYEDTLLAMMVSGASVKSLRDGENQVTRSSVLIFLLASFISPLPLFLFYFPMILLLCSQTPKFSSSTINGNDPYNMFL